MRLQRQGTKILNHCAASRRLLILLCSIKPNATASPLLRLPLEIREKIYRCALGDRMIHLKYLDTEDRFSCPRDGEMGLLKLGQSWSQMVCASGSPQDETEKAFTACWPEDNWSWFRAKARPWQYAARGSNAGLDTLSVLKRPYCTEMNLGFLRCCRQVYVETSPLPLSTNLFSFDDATSFVRLIESQKAFQRRSIQRLRLVMDWDRADAIVNIGKPSWKSALNMRLIKFLEGLR